MASATDTAMRATTEGIGEDAPFWLDSEQFGMLLRDACADAALLREMNELLPDTLAELWTQDRDVDEVPGLRVVRL